MYGTGLAPSGFPQNFTGHAISADSIFLSWSPPAEEERNGVITHYTVYVTHTLTHQTTQYNTSMEQITFSNLDPFVGYASAVSASTAAGTGPLSNLVLVQTLESGEKNCMCFIHTLHGIYVCNHLLLIALSTHNISQLRILPHKIHKLLPSHPPAFFYPGSLLQWTTTME